MKKNKKQDQEQNWKPRRLSLNRETILLLNDPALLELARGGTAGTFGTSTGNDGGFCESETRQVINCQN